MHTSTSNDDDFRRQQRTELCHELVDRNDRFLGVCLSMPCVGVRFSENLRKLKRLWEELGKSNFCEFGKTEKQFSNLLHGI